jgi:hypothetical protein
MQDIAIMRRIAMSTGAAAMEATAAMVAVVVMTGEAT